MHKSSPKARNGLNRPKSVKPSIRHSSRQIRSLHLIKSSSISTPSPKLHASRTARSAQSTTTSLRKLSTACASTKPSKKTVKDCWKCTMPNMLVTDAFCVNTDCKSVQEPNLTIAHDNYFQFFSLPIDYIIDKPGIDKTFQKLQQQFHPDLFATKSPLEQLYAEEFSSSINRSLHILTDDLLRAKYILSLVAPELIRGDEALPEYTQVPPPANHPLCPNSGPISHSSTSNPSSPERVQPRLSHQQLTMIFFKREILEDASDDQQLFELFRENETERQELVSRIGIELNQRIAPFLTADKMRVNRNFTVPIQIEDFDSILLDCELLGYYQTMQRELRERINPAMFEQN